MLLRHCLYVFVRIEGDRKLQDSFLPLRQERTNQQIFSGAVTHVRCRERTIHPQHQIRTVSARGIESFQHIIAEASLQTAVRIHAHIPPGSCVQIDKLICFRINDNDSFLQRIQHFPSDENTVLRVRIVSIDLLLCIAQPPDQQLKHFIKAHHL